jgi:hypothetical protein
MKYTILVFLCICINDLYAQYGCTDYRATNFDNSATTNDGSCLYNFTQVSLQYICTLDTIASESSGMAFANNAFWTHNDSDNPNKIYKIDTATGAKLQTVQLANATNIDWEDMAMDNTNLYIADFGNNAGNRTDLKIYAVKKNISNMDTSILATNISYTYSDQINFVANTKTNFDAEALLHFQDSLYIFTKQWGNHKTKQYQINTDSAVQIAGLIDSFDVYGLITASAISPDKKTVALLGYDTSGKSFVWLLWDFAGSRFFSGNKRRIDLGYSGGQCEAIVFITNQKIMISNETYSIFKASLSTLDIGNWIGTTPLLISSYDVQSNFDATTNTLHLSSNHNYNKMILYNMQGQMCAEQILNKTSKYVAIPNLQSGNYVLKLFGNYTEVIQIMMH